MSSNSHKREAGTVLTDDLSLLSRGNIVGMVTNVWAGPSGVWILAETRDISSSTKLFQARSYKEVT